MCVCGVCFVYVIMVAPFKLAIATTAPYATSYMILIFSTGACFVYIYD